MATAAMVLGIITVVIAFIPALKIFGFITGILAIIFGAIKVKENKKGLVGIILGGIGLIFVVISLAAFGAVPSSDDQSSKTTNNTVSEQQGSVTQKTDEEINKEIQAELEKRKKEQEASVPVEYKNALNKANSYANRQYMSKARLYDQLTSEYGEKFSADAAQYAVDNVKADWNANALEKAKRYQSRQSMSTSRIYDQLTSEYGEKFTPEEAQYAIDNLAN